MHDNRLTTAALAFTLLATPAAFAEQNQEAKAQPSAMSESTERTSPVPSLPDLQGHPSLQSGTSRVTTQEIFQRLDTDGDGNLTEEELSIYGSPAAGQGDAPKDPATAQQLLETYDTNQDGQVIFQEVEDVHNTFERQRNNQ
ncbi:EF-hand domain-containing protein [Allohahella marinimesophila]|uniref:EF-hand domain-containing protein n=1 Tax=Allohahella marinimesophila TaxID=1054972 RepID=A0ABP7QDT4_9GAMM